MFTKKIIHIKDYIPNQIDVDSSDFYLQGWPVNLCKKYLNFNDKYSVEIWRPDSIEEPISKEIGGIKAKIFPVKKVGRFYYSDSLISALKRELSKNQVIIHHHLPHNFFFYTVARLMRNYPLIAHHHGNDPPILEYDFYFDKSFFKKITRLPLISFRRFLDFRVMNNIDYYLSVGIGSLKYSLKYLSRDKISLFNGGTDFDIMKPFDKLSSRKKVGLPMDKKIILTVGSTTEIKGSNIAIEIFPLLKKEIDNLEIYWVGDRNNKNNSLTKLEEVGINCIGRKSRDEELPYFYNSADLYVNFSTHPSLTDIGGINNAIIEALGCNIPVVSMKLKNFKNPNLVNKLGKLPTNKLDLIQNILNLLEKPCANFSSRRIVKKYYSWQNILMELDLKYKNLFRIYYGN
mgnify:CR=1 FL=1